MFFKKKLSYRDEKVSMTLDAWINKVIEEDLLLAFDNYAALIYEKGNTAQVWIANHPYASCNIHNGPEIYPTLETRHRFMDYVLSNPTKQAPRNVWPKIIEKVRQNEKEIQNNVS